MIPSTTSLLLKDVSLTNYWFHRMSWYITVWAFFSHDEKVDITDIHGGDEARDIIPDTLIAFPHCFKFNEYINILKHIGTLEGGHNGCCVRIKRCSPFRRPDLAFYSWMRFMFFLICSLWCFTYGLWVLFCGFGLVPCFLVPIHILYIYVGSSVLISFLYWMFFLYRWTKLNKNSKCIRYDCSSKHIQ